MTDEEKAIKWFENIADECDKLTSGNVAHLRAQIKGMAIRSAEYLTKHSQEPASEDLEQAKKDTWFNYEYRDTDGRLYQSCFEDGFELGAQWQKESIIKMLDAEKENTGIGLCEYDAGHENGRMEVIDTLKNKLIEK